MTFAIDQNTIILIILALAIIVLAVSLLNLNAKLKKFLVGTKTENLGESIAAMNGALKDLETFKVELEEYLTTVEKRLKKSVQAVNTVRFNPFKGTGSGGNQSFATAFLNEDTDGVVVSSLYAREHVSVFSKPIKKGVSEFELTEEEKEAVAGAVRTIKHISGNPS